MLRQIPAYKFIIAACDYLVVMLAFFAAVVLRYGGVWSEMKEIPDLWTQVEFVVGVWHSMDCNLAPLQPLQNQCVSNHCGARCGYL
ncbi:MAG: hypothetical protein RML35_10770 [Chloroherpetonaceae bacterium]|nr:hypothetical protein [Chloroherpetonaceae bacterium]